VKSGTSHSNHLFEFFTTRSTGTVSRHPRRGLLCGGLWDRAQSPEARSVNQVLTRDEKVPIVYNVLQCRSKEMPLPLVLRHQEIRVALSLPGQSCFLVSALLQYCMLVNVEYSSSMERQTVISSLGESLDNITLSVLVRLSNCDP
jgi:hypothetical protein